MRKVWLFGCFALVAVGALVFWWWLQSPPPQTLNGVSDSQLTNSDVVIQPYYDERAGVSTFTVSNRSDEMLSISLGHIVAFDTHGESPVCVTEPWDPLDDIGKIAPAPPPVATSSDKAFVSGGSDIALDLTCVWEAIPRGWVTYMYDDIEFLTTRAPGTN